MFLVNAVYVSLKMEQILKVIIPLITGENDRWQLGQGQGKLSILNNLVKLNVFYIASCPIK